MKPKPVVGQTLYSLNIGNAANKWRPQVLTPVKVTKVGRKYFTCKEDDGWRETQYHLASWREKTDYTASSYLYPSPEEYANEGEKNEICKFIAMQFEYGHNRQDLSLQTLQSIKQLICSGE